MMDFNEERRLAGQGHQLVWSQPVSPMAVNSPGLLEWSISWTPWRSMDISWTSSSCWTSWRSWTNGELTWSCDWLCMVGAEFQVAGIATGPMASLWRWGHGLECGGRHNRGSAIGYASRAWWSGSTSREHATPMEPLRSSDLPLRPQPGTEQSALQFGDWITVVTPMLGDVAGSARGWWNDILREASQGCMTDGSPQHLLERIQTSSS